MGTLNFDRYHAVMGNASYKPETAVHGHPLSDLEATFYVTQRKLRYAPCLGHERLVAMLTDSHLDRPRLRFLETDRGGLELFADAIEDMHFAGAVRAVRPGTIVFAGEPFADITGAFGVTQAQEIKFEHAFDLPMTVAANALQIRMAAGDRWLSDFSLRRNGDIERSVGVASYAFIGGFNDTSNVEAAHRLDIPAVGTEAHYWQQSYTSYIDDPEIDERTGRPKHFEQVAFERWLDANPNGTTILLDTVDVYHGAVHAVLAATSSETRRRAFKGYRIDSGDLAAVGAWCHRFFEANGLHGLMPILTGDLDADGVASIVERFPEAAGFGIGTKLISEVEAVAGVIFKQCVIGGVPTMKLSSTVEKSTLPGRLQVYRGADASGRFVGDVIGLDGEPITIDGASTVEPLLVPFWTMGYYEPIPSIAKLKAYVESQRTRFADIDSYPVTISDRLRSLRESLVERMRAEPNDWRSLVTVPSELEEQLMAADRAD
jgi:nicotinate phosphoribosyltransferase